MVRCPLKINEMLLEIVLDFKTGASLNLDNHWDCRTKNSVNVVLLSTFH